MKNPIFAATLLCLAVMPSLTGADPISVDYHYQGDSTVSLETMSGGPISAASFTDERADAPDAHTLTLDGEVLRIEPALTDLIRQAYAEGMEQAGADMGSSDTPLTLRGNLSELEASRTSDGGIELIIRCQTILQKGARDAWQTSVYSRTTTDTTDIAQALQTGLDDMVGQLFGDNYFTMQLGIY